MNHSEPNQEQQQKWNEDPSNWKWGLFYFNRKDPRIVLPKRARWLGWTLNFAHPASYYALIAVVSVIILISEYVVLPLLR